MTIDGYSRFVLSVIAAALVYLCAVFTPMPEAFAQGTRAPGARTPGESTGPAEMVIVGWRLAPDAALPVQIPGRVTVTGDVRVSNDVRVTGRVQTEQAPNMADRVVFAGWEDAGQARAPGRFLPWNDKLNQALPVSPRAVR